MNDEIIAIVHKSNGHPGTYTLRLPPLKEYRIINWRGKVASMGDDVLTARFTSDGHAMSFARAHGIRFICESDLEYK